METLSKFLTRYVKENIFNGGMSLDKPETFDEMLERVMHEGIFMYRKKMGCMKIDGFGRDICRDIKIALVDAEEPKYMDLVKRFV